MIGQLLLSSRITFILIFVLLLVVMDIVNSESRSDRTMDDRVAKLLRRRQERERDSAVEVSSDLLFLPGPLWSYNWDSGDFKCGDRSIFLSRQPNMPGTGWNIWDGSFVLSKYLEINPSLVSNRRVVEVGSGVGLVGITAAIFNAKEVILSDLPVVTSNLWRNVHLNFKQEIFNESMEWALVDNESHTRVTVAGLDWIAPDWTSPVWDQFDIVLGSDVVWIDELIDPLTSVLSHLVSESTLCYISHRTRSHRGDERFKQSLFQRGLYIRVIPHEQHHPHFRHSDINILQIIRSKSVKET